MNDASRDQLTHEIHARGVRLVIAVTGGGSGAISTLLAIPGASRSILAAAVPYAPEALREWLGGAPDEYCSAWTARAMAMAAYTRAHSYEPGATTVGVACTASLASDRPKRGPHRAHLAWQSATTTAVASIEFEKGRRTRAEEEQLTSDLVLNQVAEACGATARLNPALAADETLHAQRVVAPQEQQDLLAGRSELVPLCASNRPRPAAVFPGAFHPLHDGHRKMRRLAQQILGCPVAYEISIVNVDKPPLDFIEIETRGRQFTSGEAIWLSRAPVFVEKARLFPSATFVVGADTIARIGHERYHYGSETARDAAIASIAARGCRFLVFGRQVEGRFRTLANLPLPQSLLALCREVPEDQFHDDTSSTALRKSHPG